MQRVFPGIDSALGLLAWLGGLERSSCLRPVSCRSIKADTLIQWNLSVNREEKGIDCSG